jgi:hypothetical protein
MEETIIYTPNHKNWKQILNLSNILISDKFNTKNFKVINAKKIGMIYEINFSILEKNKYTNKSISLELTDKFFQQPLPTSQHLPISQPLPTNFQQPSTQFLPFSQSLPTNFQQPSTQFLPFSQKKYKSKYLNNNQNYELFQIDLNQQIKSAIIN